MPVEIGSRLGPYEIVAKLGAGGMGEVYRARDTRLGRDVAIKLLPDAFATDPERLARFEREAKLLASLSHANIAVLHGLEEADGRRFLVMQCVEGESLQQRLARGALPVPEALEIAAAIASALEVAHESGIVHRDLKPGNVMVTPAGEVKVLDFGLAKGGAGTSNADASLSASPTQTYAATVAGVILGTAAYMSPEQARGKPVDRRTDIWSFGCVLFELLTGTQAFAGETVSDIVARILQTEPDWALLPAATPGRLRDLLVRCLQKDARRRLRDIGDARLELDDLIAGRVSASGAHLAIATTATARPRWLVPSLAALVVFAAAAGFFAARDLGGERGGATERFVVTAPPRQTLIQDAGIQQISPDGRMLAMIAADSSGVPHVWVRPLDSLTPKLLAGTDNVNWMFWSPDSKSLAFFAADRQLLKVAIAGGAPQPICEVKAARGGSWNRDGVILLAPYSNGGIYRVPASGGDLTLVMRPDSAHGETGLRFPSFLPDGKHFLVSSLPADSTRRGRIYAASLDGGERKLLMHAESGAVYAEPGWLVWTRKNVVTAQRFDAGSLALQGEPIPLGDVAYATQYAGGPYVSVSRTGTLAFALLDPTPERLTWLDRQGHELGTVPNLSVVGFRLSLSPDGHHALFSDAVDGTQSYVTLVDLDRGIATRLTGDDATASEQVWARDGKRFACIEEGHREGLFVHSIVEDAQQSYLTDDPAFKRLDSWSADGKLLIYERLDSATKWDIWALPVDGSGPPRPVLRSPANEQRSALSPDGRWIAYENDESGIFEVYVSPFGRPGMRYQVTNGGGYSPGWSRDGKHLLFANPKRSGELMAADVKAGDDFALGTPYVYAKVPPDITGGDLDASGERLLVIEPAERTHPQVVGVVANWAKALAKP